tara:strand:+ start:738 stop:1046 length:309 start_codon:yes stop_codon:yes gene_type:complete
MKITKSELKEIILQEVGYLVSGAYGAFNLDRPEIEYKLSPIQTQISAILGNLKQIEKIIRTDDGIDRKTLVQMKEKALGDLYQAVSYVEATIEDKLKMQNED